MYQTMLQWNQVESAPDEPGIYSWYYKFLFPRFDIDELVRTVRASDERGARESVIAFLNKFVFGPLREEPYTAVIQGKLKPRYEGELLQSSGPSKEVVDRLVGDIERIRSIARVLESATPFFASPIYIGMSSNLRTRLRSHKALIERFVEARRLALGEIKVAASNTDLSFARDVARRELSPNQLLVFVRPMPIDGDACNDVENLLNRVNFPLCGRN
jgi:hypothetical protein